MIVDFRTTLNYPDGRRTYMQVNATLNNAISKTLA